MAKDMTTGSPMKLILFFSIPMLIGNLFQQFYNMVDSIVVGRYVSVEALAAVGATGSMMFTILGFAMGLTTGFSVIISQRFGAENEDGVRKAMAMSIYLSAIISAMMTLGGLLLTEPLLKLMDTPENIIQDSKTYLVIIFIGVTASIFGNLVTSVLRAVGDSRTPLYFLVLGCIINIGLDLLFVLVFHMGVAGVAWATMIAQAVACVLCLLYINWKYPMLRIHKDNWKWDRATVFDLIKLGLPTAFQTSITGLGVLILQVVVNGFGSAVVAAYTAASKVQQLSTQPLLSFGLAMATYTGQNLGAGKLDRVRIGVKRVLILIVITSVIGTVLIFAGGRQIVELFLSGDESKVEFVLQEATVYLNITAVFYFLLGALFIYRNTLQGLGNAMIPMISGILELGIRVVVALLLPKLLGFAGIAFADTAAWIGAAILLCVSYYQNIRKLEFGRRV